MYNFSLKKNPKNKNEWRRLLTYRNHHVVLLLLIYKSRSWNTSCCWILQTL